MSRYIMEDYEEQQEKHRLKLQENREKLLARKKRTRRLIARGAIAESLIPDSDVLSNEEFRDALYKLAGK